MTAICSNCGRPNSAIPTKIESRDEYLMRVLAASMPDVCIDDWGSEIAVLPRERTGVDDAVRLMSGLGLIVVQEPADRYDEDDKMNIRDARMRSAEFEEFIIMWSDGPDE